MNNDERRTEALASADLPFSAEGATVERERRPVKIVFSARIPAEYSQQITEEAERCGQNPSQLIADLVVEALAARQQDQNASIPVSAIKHLLAVEQLRHAA